MEMMEIILLIAGGVVFVLSFLVPDRRGAAGSLDASSEKEVRNLVRQELESLRSHVDDVVEESITYAMEKTERSLERLSNEKIIAVNEYSDTVLAQIHKNHEEAVFLYDMLNNKQASLKNMLADLNKAVKEAEETLQALQKAAQTAYTVREEKAPEEASGQSREMAAVVPAQERPETETGALLEEELQESNHNEQILGLYRQGKSAMAIARELGLGMGEVKLVIGLFQNQSQS